MYLDDPYRTRYRYTDLFHLGIAYNPSARDVLFVGLGAGSSEKRMWRDFPQLRLHAVELDPVVVDVAYRYFGLPRDPRLQVDVGDGRRFLAGNEQRWDVIVIDAFFADAIPAHLVTQEFLALARSRLGAGRRRRHERDRRARGAGLAALPLDLQDLPHRVPVRARPPGDPARRPGRRAVPQPDPGRDREGDARPAQLADRWDDLRRENPRVPDLRKPILDRRDGVIATDDVPVLTDDYAPTDALLLLFQ